METLRRLIRYFWLFAVLALLGINASSLMAAEGGPVFNNGPYLLAPKTDSMVVVWESSKSVPATIWYGRDKDKLDEKVSVFSRQNGSSFPGLANESVPRETR